MRKWKRCLNMLLTAVICFTVGIISGKRVYAGIAQVCNLGQAQKEIINENTGNFTGLLCSNENTVYVQNNAVLEKKSGTGFWQKDAVYWARGPGDDQSPCFEDSG